LSEPIPALASRFYEKAREFAWHPGLQFPESFIQTSYLKDLVTPVAPTSRYSFLSFLVEHKRFYSFLTASFPRVSRAEFNQYLAWVARSLPNLEFDCPVLEIDYQDDFWQVTTRMGVVRACDLVLGTGLRPHVPALARPFVGRSLHHAIHFNHYQPELAGRRVAVIGGGQSGAEVVHHALLDGKTLPSELLWVSRRAGFPQLDDSPFANELFTPEYSDHFYRLDEGEQRRLLNDQTLASDGVSVSLLQDIYRRLYTLQFAEGRRPVRLLPGHDPARTGGTCSQSTWTWSSSPPGIATSSPITWRRSRAASTARAIRSTCARISPWCGTVRSSAGCSCRTERATSAASPIRTSACWPGAAPPS
jgi:lysine N6-hydroxylase